MKIILKLFLKIFCIIRVLRTALYMKTEFYVNIKLSVKNIFSQSDTIIKLEEVFESLSGPTPHAKSRLD